MDVGEEFDPEVVHHPLTHELQQVDLGEGEERFGEDHAEEGGGQHRQAGQLALHDMGVDSDFEDPGLGQLGSGDRRQQQQRRHHHASVGHDIADETPHQLAVVHLADNLVLIYAAKMH